MLMVRFRVIGHRDAADTIISGLHGISGIEHVEEVDDLAPEMRDDSSSSESIGDNEGRIYRIEVEAPNDKVADIVRGSAEAIAFENEAGIEFVDEF